MSAEEIPDGLPAAATSLMFAAHYEDGRVAYLTSLSIPVLSICSPL
jgi:hypothetical protein